MEGDRTQGIHLTQMCVSFSCQKKILSLLAKIMLGRQFQS